MSNSRYNKSERKFENDPTPGFNVPLTAAANRFLGGPSSGSAATPSFRAIVPDDLPGAASGARGIIKLAGQLGGTADLPDVRGIRETGGPTLLTFGAWPDGYLLKRVGTTAVGVSISSVVGLREAAGFDTTALSGVISHWKILTSIQGGTSLPDTLSAHTGTIGTGTYAINGRPFYSSAGNALMNQNTTLANTSNLLSEAATTCGFMAWCAVEKPAAEAVLFTCNASGETSATNCQFQASLLTTGALKWFSEHGSGTDDVVNGPKVAPGLRLLLFQREHNTGAGTSTITFGIDGVFVQATTGVTNPSGGSSTSGALMPLGTDGVYLGECLLYSGATMTEAQFLAQYQRGMGSY